MPSAAGLPPDVCVRSRPATLRQRDQESGCLFRVVRDRRGAGVGPTASQAIAARRGRAAATPRRPDPRILPLTGASRPIADDQGHRPVADARRHRRPYRPAARLRAVQQRLVPKLSATETTTSIGLRSGSSALTKVHGRSNSFRANKVFAPAGISAAASEGTRRHPTGIGGGG